VLLHVWDTRSQWPPRVVPVPAPEKETEDADTSDQASAGGD